MWQNEQSSDVRRTHHVTTVPEKMRGLERQNEKLRQMYIELLQENQQLKQQLRCQW